MSGHEACNIMLDSIPGIGLFESLNDLIYATAGYFIVHIIAYYAWKFAGIDYSKFSYSDVLTFPEKICSSLNGVILTVSSFKMIFIDGLFTDRLFVYNESIHLCFIAALAYQIYDLIIMMLQKTDPLSMWIHHSVALLGFVALIETHQFAFYPVAFMLTEITVLFVNSLWYAKSWKIQKGKASGKDDNPLISSLTRLRAFSYIVFRSWVGPWVLFVAFSSGDVYRFQFLKLVPKFLGPLNVLIMTILNFKWTFLAIKSLNSNPKGKKATN